MCKDATSTAATLMKAIEPTLLSLLNLLGISSTPDGIAAVNAFNTAQQELAAWQPGTTAQTVVQAITAFSAIFNVLPIPADAKTLANIIAAGIIAVLGVVIANSPAPEPVASAQVPEAFMAATAEETQVMHQAAVVHDTTSQVQNLVPEFKRSIFTSPAHQYKNAWNREASKNPKYEQLKVK